MFECVCVRGCVFVFVCKCGFAWLCVFVLISACVVCVRSHIVDCSVHVTYCTSTEIMHNMIINSMCKQVHEELLAGKYTMESSVLCWWEDWS